MPAEADPGTRFGSVDAAGLDPWVDRLVGLYAQVYADPPWREGPDEVAAFRARLERHQARAGFRAELSVAVGTGSLVGACYGYESGGVLPDEPFYRAVRAAVGPEAEGSLVGDVLQLPELLVAGTARRRGIGRRLLEAKLSTERRAWLCTRSDAPALTLYRSLGFVVRGRLEPPYEFLVVCTWWRPSA